MGWPKSLRWRYSLRALFVFITLFMIWGGYHANRGWRQRAAEEVLRKHGATISYGDGRIRDDLYSRLAGSYQDLVHRLWGECHIHDVGVQSALEPEVVNALEALPQLEGLGIAPKRFSQEENLQFHRTGSYGTKAKAPAGALRRILAPHRMTQLGLYASILDDDDCQAIAGHHHIEHLFLIGCDLTERGFADLLTLPHLKTVNFSDSHVAGDKLAAVAGSDTLEWIECRRTGVGTEFAKYIARCPNVKKLRLWGDSIDDEFTAALGPHPTLSDLALMGPVTDAAANSLSGMPRLEIVTVPRGALSDKAIARLKSANPQLFISQ